MLLQLSRRAPSSLLAAAARRVPLASAPLQRSSIWADALGGRASLSTDAAAASEEQPQLIITARCAKRIVRLNRKKGLEDPALQRQLRLSVEPGGCSGFSYKFELEDASEMDEESDVVIEKDGARVVVDDASLELLAGATVDFEDEMMKSAFVIAANPQSEASCGCGTSFQAKDL